MGINGKPKFRSFLKFLNRFFFQIPAFLYAHCGQFYTFFHWEEIIWKNPKFRSQNNSSTNNWKLWYLQQRDNRNLPWMKLKSSHRRRNSRKWRHKLFPAGSFHSSQTSSASVVATSGTWSRADGVLPLSRTWRGQGQERERGQRSQFCHPQGQSDITAWCYFSNWCFLKKYIFKQFTTRKLCKIENLWMF